VQPRTTQPVEPPTATTRRQFCSVIDSRITCWRFDRSTQFEPPLVPPPPSRTTPATDVPRYTMGAVTVPLFVAVNLPV